MLQERYGLTTRRINETVAAAVKPAAERVDTTPGTLIFRIFPYATISLDGRVLGETPLPPQVVSPGLHQIRLVNAKLQKDFLKAFDVKPGASNIFKMNLKSDAP